MSLLFDQNLSHVLCESIQHLFPGSIHVKAIQFEKESDTAIWDYAGKKNLTIITKDSDFHQRSFLFGHPPKVIWLRTGNCTTTDLFNLITSNVDNFKAFLDDTAASYFILHLQ